MAHSKKYPDGTSEWNVAFGVKWYDVPLTSSGLGLRVVCVTTF
jgi:hypothetical protein